MIPVFTPNPVNGADDWSGEHMTKEAAKKYAREYRK